MMNISLCDWEMRVLNSTSHSRSLLVPHELRIEAAIIVADMFKEPPAGIDHSPLNPLGHAGGIFQSVEQGRTFVHGVIKHAVYIEFPLKDRAFGSALGTRDDLLGETGIAAGLLDLGRQIDVCQCLVEWIAEMVDGFACLFNGSMELLGILDLEAKLCART